MANSRYYTATKEDARSWRSDHDVRASALDEAAVDHADAIQTATRDSNPITSIVVSPSTATIDLSEEETVQLSVQPKVDSEDYDDGVQVTWASSDEAKATVDETGLVTPVAAGSATITATCVHDTNIDDTATITVQS